MINASGELFQFHPDFAPDTGGAGGGVGGAVEKTEQQKREEQFADWMGPEITKVREVILTHEAATGSKIPLDQKQMALNKVGYIEAFKKAIKKSGVAINSPEWIELTKELREWCGYSEKKEEEPKKVENKQSINSQTDLEAMLLKYEEISDPQTKINTLSRLASILISGGKIEFANKVTTIVERLKKIASTAGIDGLPNNIEDESEWIKWVRDRLALLFVPTDEGRGQQNIFSVIKTVPGVGGMVNRTQENGTVYIQSQDLRRELIDDDIPGNNAEASELKITQSIARLYSEWKTAHSKLDSLIAAVDNGNYKMPEVKLTKKIFNKLRSEDGVDPEGGSKLVSKAVQLYWAMAHSNEAEGQEILRANDLDGIKSIYNSASLTDTEISDIRKRIAEKCGGAYYESLGFCYASFLGISAYGSDNPAAPNGDKMGLLIHSEVNMYDDNTINDPGKRKNRYLRDEIANALVLKKGKESVRDRNGRRIPVEIGFHSSTLQELEGAKEPRSFYVLRHRNSTEKYKIVKKIGEAGTDFAQDRNADRLRLSSDYEEVLFDDLIKEGRLHEINWGDSADVFGMIKSKEGDALGVYKLFKNTDDTIEKIDDVADLVKKRDTFESALARYNKDTQKNAMFLWAYSIIAKNRAAWTGEDRRNQLIRVIDKMKNNGLITDEQRGALRKEFNLTFFRDLFK